MSATNRGAVRQDLDWYETPMWCIWQLLDRVEFGQLILDPGCGTGPILHCLVEDDYPLAVGIELDEKRAARASRRGPGLNVAVGDFLTWRFRADYFDAVVSNPPYGKAREFINRSLEVVKPDGLVAMLLRLNFLGSSRDRMDVVGYGSGLYRVLVMSRRPSFINGNTDYCDYAWIVWKKGFVGTATVEVMPTEEV